MKEIKLTQGKIALVDDEDFERLSRFKWHVRLRGNIIYAARSCPIGNGKYRRMPMHREVLRLAGATPIIDHRDLNGLNNQKSNIRICTHEQNRQNKGPLVTNTSGIKGVSWDKKNKRWVSHICCHGKQRNLGRFSDKESATIAYNSAALKLHGEFACLNDAR